MDKGHIDINRLLQCIKELESNVGNNSKPIMVVSSKALIKKIKELQDAKGEP